MRKEVLLLMGVVWACFFMTGAGAEPSLKVLPEKMKLGPIAKGSVIPFTVQVKNTGPETVKVSVVKLSCGSCTHVEGPRYDIPLQPQETHPFSLVFESANKPHGAFSNYVIFEAEGKGAKRATLAFMGEVVQGPRVYPAGIYEKVPAGETLETQLRLELPPKLQAALKVDCDLPKAQLELAPADSQSGNRTLHFTYPEPIEKTVKGTITLRYPLESGEEGRYLIPVLLEKKKAVSLNRDFLTVEFLDGACGLGEKTDFQTSETLFVEHEPKRVALLEEAELGKEWQDKMTLKAIGVAETERMKLVLRFYPGPELDEKPFTGELRLLIRMENGDKVPLKLELSASKRHPVTLFPSALYFRLSQGQEKTGSPRPVTARILEGLTARFLKIETPPPLGDQVELRWDAKLFERHKQFHIFALPKADAPKGKVEGQALFHFDFGKYGEFAMPLKVVCRID